MNEHPILFSTLMVQAILDGRKTNTRRLNGLDKVNEGPNAIEFLRFQEYKDGSYRAIFQHKLADEPGSVKCPYGQPGDLLWVKEAFFAYGHWTCVTDSDNEKSWSFQDLTISEGFQYKYVDCPPEKVYKNRGHLGWYERPSMFMPKVAARIWLQVEDIRVERLHDISWNDAIAEGIHVKYWGECSDQPYAYRKSKPEAISTDYRKSPIEAFQDLWEGINASESWKSNPWVWVVKYKVLSTTGKPETEPG